MRTCYNCCNYFEMGSFGGYVTSNCKLFGSLDVDQRERHPTTSAETCKFYDIECEVLTKQTKQIDFRSLNLRPFKDF